MLEYFSPYRRIKRGDVYYPVRYWSAFIIGSVIVHLLTLTPLSDITLSFIQKLRAPQAPSYSAYYVGLIYQAPAPLNLPRKETPAAPTQQAPGKQTTLTKQKNLPKAPSARNIPVQSEFDKDTEPDIVVSEPAHRLKPEKGKKEPPGAKTPEMPAPDDKFERVISFPDVVEEGAIVVIRGPEKSTYQITHADMPTPAVIKNYSTTKIKPYLSRPEQPQFQPEPYVAYSSMKTSITPGRPRYDHDMPTPAPKTAFSVETSNVIASKATADKSEVPAVAPAPSPEPGTVMKTYSAIMPYGTVVVSSYSEPPRALAVAPHELKPALPGSDIPSGPPPTLQADKEPVQPNAAMPPPEGPSSLQRPKIIEILSSLDKESKGPAIKITHPSGGDTDQGLVDVKGTVLGEGVRSVFLAVGKREMELLVRDGAFEATVALDEGRNVLTATAADVSGRSAQDRVVVNYSAAGTGPVISFTSPKENSIIDALKDKELMVSGAVTGQGVDKIRLYMNNAIADVGVEKGRFSKKVLLQAEDNVLFAEATDNSGRTSRSREIRFKAVNLSPSDFNVRVSYKGADGRFNLKYKWVAHPASKMAPAPVPPEFRAAQGATGGLVSVGEAVPGIYTAGVEYDTDSGKTVEAVFEVALYGYDPSRKKTRTIGPVKLTGKGYIPAVRVLLPECVFWEDDSWFSGIMESGSVTTKYKEPEGIVWKEEE